MMNQAFWDYGAMPFSEIEGQAFMHRGLSTRWVKADMVLGNAHAGCRGAGICKISVHGQLSVPSICGCECNPVLLTYVNNCCVQLILDKRDLSFGQHIKHFGENEAAVHKVIPLPYPLCTALGYPANIKIDVQNVDVHEDGFYYYLFMRVSKTDK